MKCFVFGFVCFLVRLLLFNFFFSRRRQPQQACELTETTYKRGTNLWSVRERGERLEQCPLGDASGSRASVEELSLGALTVILQELSGSHSITAQGRCYDEIMRKFSSYCPFLMIQEAWLSAKKEEGRVLKCLGEKKSWWFEEKK